MEYPTDKDGLLLKHQLSPPFRCEDRNIDYRHVHLHYYQLWQVEPCQQLGDVARRLLLHAWANTFLVTYKTVSKFDFNL